MFDENNDDEMMNDDENNDILNSAFKCKTKKKKSGSLFHVCDE